MHADPVLLGHNVMSLGNQFLAFEMNVKTQIPSDTTSYLKQETTPNPQHCEHLKACTMLVIYKYYSLQ
jgi:hypothetical protein